MNREKFNKKLEAKGSVVISIMLMLSEIYMKWKNRRVTNNVRLRHVDNKRQRVRNNRRLALLDHSHQVVWNYEKAFEDKPTQGLQR